MKQTERPAFTANILWIEGKRAESPSFVPELRRKGFTVETVPTGKAGLARLSAWPAVLVVVNAASFRTSGRGICQDIRRAQEKVPILLIANPQHPLSKDPSADIVLVLPFTVRKLVNRIQPLLPVTSNNVMQVGAIRLDIEHNQVRCRDKETQITPRLTRLLKTLMQHSGTVVEREDLFREVWNTAYTGDTRTLDVHVSWLRQAIEVDPHRPQFLKTIRGIGYRLDL